MVTNTLTKNVVPFYQKRFRKEFVIGSFFLRFYDFKRNKSLCHFQNRKESCREGEFVSHFRFQ